MVEQVKGGQTIVGLYPRTKDEHLATFEAWPKNAAGNGPPNFCGTNRWRSLVPLCVASAAPQWLRQLSALSQVQVSRPVWTNWLTDLPSTRSFMTMAAL